MSSGYAPGTFRVWDGSSWVFKADEWTEPTYEFIKLGAAAPVDPTDPVDPTPTPVAASTTTSISRSTSSVRKGNSVTLTATTTGRGGSMEFYFRTGTSGTWTKIATKAVPTTSGTVTAAHAPSVSGSYYAKYVGTASYKTSSSAATAVVTVLTKKVTTKTVGRSWHQAYNGSGGRISGSGRDNAVHQGYYSSTHGNRKSLIRFNPNLPDDAVVTKVVFKCNGAWEHWYASAGGTIGLGYFLRNSTEPSTWPSGDTSTNKTSKSVGTGSWSIDISSWANSIVKNSTFSGITIGPGPTTSTTYYGYSKSTIYADDFELAITYEYWS